MRENVLAIFGAPEPGRVHAPRRGAYGIATRDGPTGVEALFVDEDGELLLPGGGIDPGESEREALERETIEETGWRVEPNERIGLIVRFQSRRKPAWTKLCVYFRMQAIERIGPPSEPDAAPLWLPLEGAIDRLATPNDRWAARWALERTA